MHCSQGRNYLNKVNTDKKSSPNNKTKNNSQPSNLKTNNF